MSRVKLNLPGFTQFRRDPATRRAVEQVADDVAARANSMASKTIKVGVPVYSVATPISTQVGSIALVTTRGNLAATIDNAAHNTLLKAVGGA
ncbi:MAG TPA: hypothetical protein K8W03_07460 [Bifidobacterium pseudolongum subsp. globosum]|nr:hypothetical protein [Bifidobacterium pseudolongum subsp. globosum]